jgi:hypothetical protein
MAQKWGMWHEVWATDHTSAPDTLVDYHNNYVGRLFGSSAGGIYGAGSAAGALSWCLIAWSKGWLFYADDLKRLHWSDGRLATNAHPGPNNP